MGINGNQSKNLSSPYIVGFILLFTPLFFIGIIIIIWSLFSNKNKDKNIIDKKIITNHSHNRHKTIIPGKNLDAYNEDLRDYKEYKRKTFLYEQAVRPIFKKRNPSNRCEVCRNINKAGNKYCEICKEILDDCLVCTFCKTRNELGSTHCKNCGIKFVK